MWRRPDRSVDAAVERVELLGGDPILEALAIADLMDLKLGDRGLVHSEPQHVADVAGVRAPGRATSESPGYASRVPKAMPMSRRMPGSLRWTLLRAARVTWSE